MFCINCGTKLPDTAKFCFICGHQVNQNFIEYPHDRSNQKQTLNLKKILSNITSIEEKVISPKKRIDPQNLFSKAKNSLNNFKKNTISDKDKQLILKYIQEFINHHIEDVIAEEQANLNQLKSMATDGQYAYMIGNILSKYDNCFYRTPMGNLEQRYENSIFFYKIAQRYNDIYSALAAWELSIIYAPSINEETEPHFSNIKESAYWEKRSLSLLKKYALHDTGINRAIALQYLYFFYDSVDNEEAENILKCEAINAFKEIYASHRSTAYAAEQIGWLYDAQENENKADKWMNLAQKAYLDEMNDATGSSLIFLKYHYYYLLKDYYNKDQLVYKNYEDCDITFSQIFTYYMKADALSKKLELESNNLCTFIDSICNIFKNKIASPECFYIENQTIQLGILENTLIHLRKPFMERANYNFIQFIDYYEHNIFNLNTVYTKAIPLSDSMLSDVFDMGIELAHDFGVTINYTELQKLTKTHLANKPYYYNMTIISNLIKDILQEESLQREKSDNTDYNWVDFRSGLGLSGLIGGLVTASIVNLGTNLIANLFLYLTGNTSSQIANKKFYEIFQNNPKIKCWLAELLYYSHLAIFRAVIDKCIQECKLPPLENDETSSLNSFQKISLNPISLFAGDYLIDIYNEHKTESDKNILENILVIVNHLGLNSIFAKLYYFKYEYNKESEYKFTLKDTIKNTNKKFSDFYKILNQKNESEEGIIFTSIDIPNKYTITDFIIPDGYKVIGKNAFSFCPNLRSLIIPTSIISVEDRAFSNCPKLTDILFPNATYEIGNEIFKNSSHVLVESLEGGSWENYLKANYPISNDLESHFAILGNNKFKIAQWHFHDDGILLDDDYDIKASKNILQYQQNNGNIESIDIYLIYDIEFDSEFGRNITFSYKSNSGYNEFICIWFNQEEKQWHDMYKLLKYIQHYNITLYDKLSTIMLHFR